MLGSRRLRTVRTYSPVYVGMDNMLREWIRGEAKREGLTSAAWIRRILMQHRTHVEARRGNGEARP